MDAETGGPGRAKVSVGAVEDLIRSFSGVESARIALDAQGSVREVHVLADSSRPPKAIVRDIESGLRARWGLVVDHRRISVAQMDDAPRRPKWTRLRLQQISVQTDPVRGRVEVAVSLAPEPPRDAFGRPVYDPEVPNVIWQGRAAGASGGGLAIRLAAEATLQALNQSLLPQHTFSVVDLQRVPIAERDAILCLMQYQAPRGAAEMLTGSALVRSDPLEAAVRCVLNSTNRIYGVAMRRHVAGATPVEEPAGHEWPGEVAAGVEPEVEVGEVAPPTSPA